MKGLTKFLVITFVTATATLSVNAAKATGNGQRTDSKVHAGAFCQAIIGTQVGDITTFPAGIRNASQQARAVTCPILRDNVLNTDGTRNVRVRINNPPGQRFSCTLYSIDPLFNSTANNSASTTTPGKQELSLDVNTSQRTGYYVVDCSVPSGGFIYNYLVQEFRPTDPD